MGLSSSIDHGGYFSPLVPVLKPLLQEVDVLFGGPLALVDARVQSSKPSLAALLPVSVNREEVSLVY